MTTYNTRILLKSDSETKWLAVESTFKPLQGEMIIYLPDNDHSYCRVKIGDGHNVLKDLDFIDAGTINGQEVELVKFNGESNRPAQGSSDKLYVDTSTNSIYHYNNGTYAQLSNFKYKLSQDILPVISNWQEGSSTVATIENNTLKIINGLAPRLQYTNYQVTLIPDTTSTTSAE